MKPNMSAVAGLLFFLLLSFAAINISFCNGSTYMGCIQSEKQALLSFKQDLTDPSNRLASWIGDGDCCKWTGVVCDNFTGHVLQLNLRNPQLECDTDWEACMRSQLTGKINPSLFDLKHLSHLDLSFNYFEGIQIPRFFGSMGSLRYLNLSRAGFMGMIPQQLGNLSNLQYLDLHCYFNELYVENLNWMSGLSSLKQLDLSGVDLNNASDWLLRFNSLPSLVILQLSSCQLKHFPQVQIANCSSLIALDLSHNPIIVSSLISSWIFHLSHLVFLDLSSNNFQGPIPNAFENLTSLKHFDLSNNEFNSSIPNWLSSFDLEYLNLAHNRLQGSIPSSLGNLTSLETLDLSSNILNGAIPRSFERLCNLRSIFISIVSLNSNMSEVLDIFSRCVSARLESLGFWNTGLFGHLTDQLEQFKNLKTLILSDNFIYGLIPSFLGELSCLTTLDLSNNMLSGNIPSSLGELSSLIDLELQDNELSGHIPSSLGKLSSLKSLSLAYNKLNGSIPSSLGKLSSLKSLSLAYNKLNGSIPSSLGELSCLTTLDLSGNMLSGNVPSSLGELSSLIELELRENELSGHIPSSLGKLSSLGYLFLEYNKLNGSIPSSLGNLSNLDALSLAYNELNGTLTQVHFANLTKLTFLFASGNSLTLKVNPDWVPPFQLDLLKLGSCHLGPHFPLWLQSQKYLSSLDISDAKILDVIPDWFWKSISSFVELNLSHNQIHGEIPNLIGTHKIVTLDLSSNNLSGVLPLMSIDVNALDLSNNVLSGSISHFLCNGMNESRTTEILSLKSNLLTGELPDCWTNWKYLLVLNLKNNEFTGNLPTSMGTLGVLQALILKKNSLFGIIPSESFENCTDLEALDVTENKFVGNVPTWIGDRFPSMKILKLGANKFHGLLPMELCRLSSLQILDFANNNLSGSIPSCINNFSAMVTVNHSLDTDIVYLSTAVDYYLNELLLRGGNEYVYNTTLNLVRAIDLSKNNFSGEIPKEMTNLKELLWLNLSHNSLTGRIPENVGAMREIESIDFSSNQLFGEIPQSISSLTFLSYLNLANNNLTGKIPTSTQIEGFNPSYFIGNNLCGSPLPNCGKSIDETPGHENGGGKDGNEHEVDWFYVSMALGFVMGFWGLIGPLLINRRLRYTYCHFLNRFEDKIYFSIRRCF